MYIPRAVGTRYQLYAVGPHWYKGQCKLLLPEISGVNPTPLDKIKIMAAKRAILIYDQEEDTVYQQHFLLHDLPFARLWIPDTMGTYPVQLVNPDTKQGYVRNPLLQQMDSTLQLWDSKTQGPWPLPH